MTPDDEKWMPYAFTAIQTVIAGILGYVSKLLRDIRREVTGVQMEVAKHDVKLDEADKRHEQRAREIDRRLDSIERRRKHDDHSDE